MKRFIYKEKASNRIQLKAEFKIAKKKDGEQVVFNFDKKAQGLGGNINLAPFEFLSGGFFPGYLKLPLKISSKDIHMKFLNIMESCESVAEISINQVLQSTDMKIVTSQDSCHIDRYYAKNVGKIKSTTTFKEMRVVIDVTDPLKTRKLEFSNGKTRSVMWRGYTQYFWRRRSN